jgi:hypothetical protein
MISDSLNALPIHLSVGLGKVHGQYCRDFHSRMDPFPTQISIGHETLEHGTRV